MSLIETYTDVSYCVKCGLGKVVGTEILKNSYTCKFCQRVSRLAKAKEDKEEPEDIRVCIGCGLAHFKKFSKDSRTRDGLSNRCKECTKDFRLEGNLRRKYGLTLDRFKEMIKRQENKCMICLEKKSLVVDHCHSTGIVRGLLCNQCNTMLGLAKECEEIMKRAIGYVRKSRR